VEFLAPRIPGVSDGISGGRNLTFLPKFPRKISAPCIGKNFAQEIRVSTLWKKIYHLHKESPAISSRTKVKQEVELCVRKKSFRDDGGLG
jgi:hypothetical protein